MIKIIVVAMAAALAASPASAQISCYRASGMTFCNPGVASPTFGEGLSSGLLQGQAIASNYAMVNAYREAHGMPRCHWGWLGAITASSNGEPMC